MHIPFFTHTNSSDKTYLGIFLKEAEAVAMLLEKQGKTIVLKDLEHFSYTNGLENLVEDLDEVLFRMEKKHKTSLKDTIFFMYSHFIDETRKEIKKPYIVKIKEIMKNLELRALGYIECCEAVVKQLETQEELSLSAVLIELDKTNIDVLVYKSGRQIFRKTIARTDDTLTDITQCLIEAKDTTLLPTRVLLYDAGNIHEYSTALITHKWDENLFVQLPKVDVVTEKELINGLVKTFEEQLATENLGAETEEKKEEEPEQKEMVEGFVIGKDIETERVPQTVKPVPRSMILPIQKAFSRIKKAVKGLSVGLLAVIGLLTIGGGFFLNEYYLHTATLKLFLPTKTIKQAVKLTGTVNPKGDNIRLYISTSEAQFSDTKTTTGIKEIGDSARGTVTVYNLEDKEKLIAKGTSLSVGALKFTLDGDITLPAASIDSNTNETTPGKVQGNITASSIGSESNLDKGKRFKIDDLSQTIYYAINESAFTGGSKKQIQTVSRKDIEDIKNTILKKATTVKNQKETARLPSDANIIESLSQTAISDFEQSREVGEEAGTVTVKATVGNTTYYFKNKELTDYFMKLLEKEERDGYRIEPSSLSYSLRDAELKDTVVTVQTTLLAKEIKSVDPKIVLTDITGKSTDQAGKLLKEKYHVAGYELQMNEPIPPLKSIFPFFSRNIHLFISGL